MLAELEPAFVIASWNRAVTKPGGVGVNHVGMLPGETRRTWIAFLDNGRCKSPRPTAM